MNDNEEVCSDRIRRNTREEINARIDRQIERNIGYMSTQPEETIRERLSELEEEIDIDTFLGRLSSTASLIGLALGTVVNKRLFVLPALVQGFYLNHMLRGWCPPLPVLRRLGVRTAREIESEKEGLRALLNESQSRSRINNQENAHSGQNGHTQKASKQEAK